MLGVERLKGIERNEQEEVGRGFWTVYIRYVCMDVL